MARSARNKRAFKQSLISFECDLRNSVGLNERDLIIYALAGPSTSTILNGGGARDLPYVYAAFYARQPSLTAGRLNMLDLCSFHSTLFNLHDKRA